VQFSVSFDRSPDVVLNFRYFRTITPKFPLPYMSLNNFMGNKIEMQSLEEAFEEQDNESSEPSYETDESSS
jgi:hypothetical protein